MILTEREKEFLDTFLQEATTDPFNGPATAELHRRDIYYADLSQLMAAYYREQEHFKPNPERPPSTVPPCPWPDRNTALERNRTVQHQLAATIRPVASSSGHV